MDGGDSSRNARQSLNRFRYPGAQHARVQYGTRKGFDSQGAGSSQPSWSSQRDRVDVSDNEIALVQDDVPLDAFGTYHLDYSSNIVAVTADYGLK